MKKVFLRNRSKPTLFLCCRKSRQKRYLQRVGEKHFDCRIQKSDSQEFLIRAKKEGNETECNI